MPERQLRILREGVDLGTFPETEVRELLELGVLKAGDLVAGDEGHAFCSLGELDLSSASEPKRSWLATARDSVAHVADAAASSAELVVGKVKSLATVPPAVVSTATAKFLDGCSAQIEKALASVSDSRPMQAIRSGVRDDGTMTKVFGAAYDVLPRPVCRFVSEERFIAYCMQHRARLLRLPEAQPGEGRE